MTVLSVIAFGGPVALAVLGLIVTGNRPKTPRGRWGWYWVFGIIGVVSVTAAAIDARQRDKSLEEMLTGGDNYAYLWAELDSVKNTTDPVHIWLKASGLLYGVNYWIAPAGVSDPNDKRYWSIGGGYFPETKGGIRVGRTLPPGKYRVEFSARNGSTIQILEIMETGGKLRQLIDVFRHGTPEAIYSNH